MKKFIIKFKKFYTIQKILRIVISKKYLYLVPILEKYF